MSDRGIIGTRGKRSVISTSKIRKITAIRKNRREKGIRADPLGSNPHSKGEFFSRSLIVFLDRIEERAIRRLEMVKITRIQAERSMIIFPGAPSPADWKSAILIY